MVATEAPDRNEPFDRLGWCWMWSRGLIRQPMPELAGIFPNRWWILLAGRNSDEKRGAVGRFLTHSTPTLHSQYPARIKL